MSLPEASQLGMDVRGSREDAIGMIPLSLYVRGVLQLRTWGIRLKETTPFLPNEIQPYPWTSHNELGDLMIVTPNLHCQCLATTHQRSGQCCHATEPCKHVFVETVSASATRFLPQTKVSKHKGPKVKEVTPSLSYPELQ